jgi:deazaflavin-dependent oxidoreductase (nitroreductase family)
MLPKGCAVSGHETFQQQVIAEFRANGGVVGGMFEGIPLLLMTTAGAKTGRPHTTPVVYSRDGGRYLVFASNAVADTDPQWYRNLLECPQATLEIGEAGSVVPHAARAVPLEGEERDRHYEIQAGLDPAFRRYQDGTERTIPVVALYPLEIDAARGRAIAGQLLVHHRELREALAAARAELDGRSREERPSLHRELLGHCVTFCNGLRMHHIREDGAFTAIQKALPGLAPALDRLREEHEAVSRALLDLDTLLRRRESTGIAELREEFERVAAGLEEHFAYEEANLLPALRGE